MSNVYVSPNVYLISDGVGALPFTLSTSPPSEGGGGGGIVYPGMVTWKIRADLDLAQVASWNDIAYGNSRWVAVSYYVHPISVSNDGLNWKARGVPGELYINNDLGWDCIAFSPTLGMFCIGTSSGESVHRLAISTDGDTWTPVNEGIDYNPNNIGFNILDICWAGNKFVAAGVTTNAVLQPIGTPFIITSFDGSNWTEPVYGPTVGDIILKIEYQDGIYLGILRHELADPNPTTSIVTSSDGVTWVEQIAVSTTQWTDIAYGNGKWVAVCIPTIDYPNSMVSSVNGVDWVAVLDNTTSWVAIDYDVGSGFVASSGENYIARSFDGDNWNTTSLDPAYTIYGAAYGSDKNRWIAIAGSAPADRDLSVYSVDDGDSWQSYHAIPISTVTLSSATFNGTNLVVLGNDSTLDIDVTYTSTNFKNWTPHSQDTLPYNLMVHTWTGTTYIASIYSIFTGEGSPSGYATSPDGITWTEIAGSPYPLVWIVDPGTWNRSPIYCLNHLNGLTIGLSENEIHVSNDDGQTWDVEVFDWQSHYFTNVAYGNGLYVVTGYSSIWTPPDTYLPGVEILTSTDGVIWTPRTGLGGTNWWNGVAYGNGIWVVVGGEGDDQTMVSTDGINWVANNGVFPLRQDDTNYWWTSVSFINGKFIATSDSLDYPVAMSLDGLNWVAPLTYVDPVTASPTTWLGTLDVIDSTIVWGGSYNNLMYDDIPNFPILG